MLYFIHPVDDSTDFLDKIYKEIIESIGDENVKIFLFDGKEPEDVFDEIKDIPIESNIFFLGHGRGDRLYGVLEEEYTAFVDIKKMSVFDNRNLFCLSCQSEELLTRTHRDRAILSAIGFGNLPTSQEEVNNIRHIRKRNITNYDVDEFKKIIVECVTKSILNFYKNSENFEYLYSYLRILLHKRMNDVVINESKRGLAELIYQMCDQMIYIEE
ncbi:conserved hypothetical protein [Vibrio chagasii]|nr:conserved hypothetical protein [Vibrio chagasii]CAH6795497.1 conserved hypothetical protein [Vibrio chagasii]CAH7441568.1 conserved hypothetical protein [Vibrio chagasii]CAH7481527.1 conserved hypothetical protein [Vibrio chagasii]